MITKKQGKKRAISFKKISSFIGTSYEDVRQKELKALRFIRTTKESRNYFNS